MSRSFDHASFSEAFNRDARQWISYGLVDKDTPDAPSVRFKDEDGKPLPYGPMVSVTLQPSGISLPCRVASQVAGQSEGEWYPYVAGDEVLVAIPEGDERAGCVIVARLNQEIDEFPLAVGGQDVTKNTIGFRRMRTPYIIETGESYLIRSAKTGSQIGINLEGNLVLNDGDGGSLLIGPEAMGLSSGDGETFMQIFPEDKEVYLGADTATFLLAASESKFISQGSISFATIGASANQMGVTAEQVVAFVINVLAQLASMGAFNPLSPLSAATYSASPPASCVTAIASVVGPALSALAGIAPLGPAPGGNFAAFVASAPPIFGAVGALAAASANPVAPVDPTGTTFGFARAGFKL